MERPRYYLVLFKCTCTYNIQHTYIRLTTQDRTTVMRMMMDDWGTIQSKSNRKLAPDACVPCVFGSWNKMCSPPIFVIHWFGFFMEEIPRLWSFGRNPTCVHVFILCCILNIRIRARCRLASCCCKTYADSVRGTFVHPLPLLQVVVSVLDGNRQRLWWTSDFWLKSF